AARPGLAEPGDRAVDDAGMRRRERVIPEPEALHRAGSEVLDDHVGARDERVEDSPRARVLQIERDALLVAVDAEEIGAFAANEWRAPGAGIVAPPRLLDLDHPRPEIGQLHRAVGPGEDSREVEDRQAVEGSHVTMKG